MHHRRTLTLCTFAVLVCVSPDRDVESDVLNMNPSQDP